MFIQKEADHREECWFERLRPSLQYQKSIVDYKYGKLLVGKNKDLFRAGTISKQRLNYIRSEFWLAS